MMNDGFEVDLCIGFELIETVEGKQEMLGIGPTL